MNTKRDTRNQALRDALLDQRTWHEAEDKALSKSARQDADNKWRRAQHREQIDAINEALAMQEPGSEPDLAPASADCCGAWGLLSEASRFLDYFANDRLDFSGGGSPSELVVKIDAALRARGVRRRGEMLATTLKAASQHAPPGCHCKPGRCAAPRVMGRQMPCRDPAKRDAALTPSPEGEAK